MREKLDVHSHPVDKMQRIRLHVTGRDVEFTGLSSNATSRGSRLALGLNACESSTEAFRRHVVRRCDAR